MTKTAHTPRPHSITPYARELSLVASQTPHQVPEWISKHNPHVHQHLAALYRVGMQYQGRDPRSELNRLATIITPGEAAAELLERSPASLATGLSNGLRRIAA